MKLLLQQQKIILQKYLYNLYKNRDLSYNSFSFHLQSFLLLDIIDLTKNETMLSALSESRIIMNETTIKKPDPKFAQAILQHLMTIDRSKNAEEMNQSLHTLLQLIGSYTDADRVYLFDKISTEPEIYSNTFEWCADGISSKLEELKYVPASYIPNWLRIFHSNRPVIIENTNTSMPSMPEECHYMKHCDIHSEFAMPIFYHSELHGFIGIDNPHNTISDLFIQQITFVGTHLSTSRENIRMLSLLAQKQEDLQQNLTAMKNERELLMVLCEDSISVFRVNLMTNTAFTVKLDQHANVTSQISPSNSLPLCYSEELHDYYEHYVQKESAPDFLELFAPSSLMQKLTDRHRVHYRFQSVPNSLGQVYFEVRATKIRQSADCFEVLIDFRHIDHIIKEEKKHQHELETALAETRMKNQILSAISKIYVSIYRIDLTTDQYEEISDDMYNTHQTHSVNGARMKFKDICCSTVASEYQDQFFNFFDLSTLARRLRYDETTAVEYLAQDGNWHLIRFIVQKRDDSGNVLEVLCVIRIISEEKRREKYWIVAAEEANRANAAKSDFLSRMSHDIRTPMNVIMGFVNLAKQQLIQISDTTDSIPDASYLTSDLEKLKDYLNKIQISGTHLQQLVNDILDMSRIESGNLELSVQPMKISETIAFLKQTIFSSQDQKSLNFVYKEHHIPYDTILADSLRLGQIYMNLLSNAVKYTPEGGTISLEIYEEVIPDSQNIRLISVISDTGIGMSPEFMQVMYSDFSRAVDTRVNKVRGSGLGLSIVKKLVDLMGGTIEVASELHHGTTFRLTFEFPYNTDADTSTNNTGYDFLPTLSDRPLTLLVAEDNELNFEILSEQLKPYKIHCIHAEDGKECLQIFKTSGDLAFNAILMDMQMPVMSGVEASIAIRSLDLPYASSVPIIATTANAYQEDIQECMNAGMNAHLSKPLDIDKLIRILGKYIKW